MPRWFRRNVSRLISGVILAAAFGVQIGVSSSPATAQTNVLFIFDASGSMRQQVEAGQTRMSVAKRAIAVALKDLPKDVRPGLLLYGHRRAKDCKDIELVAPIASEMPMRWRLGSHSSSPEARRRSRRPWKPRRAVSHRSRARTM